MNAQVDGRREELHKVLVHAARMSQDQGYENEPGQIQHDLRPEAEELFTQDSAVMKVLVPSPEESALEKTAVDADENPAETINEENTFAEAEREPDEILQNASGEASLDNLSLKQTSVSQISVDLESGENRSEKTALELEESEVEIFLPVRNYGGVSFSIVDSAMYFLIYTTTDKMIMSCITVNQQSVLNIWSRDINSLSFRKKSIFPLNTASNH